jgi:hypothetical protein
MYSIWEYRSVSSTRRSTEPIDAARVHLAAALLLGLFVFAYLWPVLVGGKIFSPIADLYDSVPWKSGAPGDLASYHNQLLVDLPLVTYPLRFLARSLIHEGTFPAWNPYVLGGIPFFSNSQNGLFSPFNLPLWILPLTYGLGVSAALKLLAGAFGTYLLVRELRLGVLPGLLAGIAFAFAAVNIVWLSHETLPGVVLMLPWAILLIERIFARGRPGSALWLAVAVAIGLGGGHPGMQVHLLVVSALYVVARAACAGGKAREHERAMRLRGLALAGCGLAAGVLLMAFMLIPEARSSHETVGVLARKAGSLPGESVSFGAIRTVAFPDWWGRPSRFEAVANPADIPVFQANFNERTLYAAALRCCSLASAWSRAAAGGARPRSHCSASSVSRSRSVRPGCTGSRRICPCWTRSSPSACTSRSRSPSRCLPRSACRRCSTPRRAKAVGVWPSCSPPASSWPSRCTGPERRRTTSGTR